MMQAKRLISSVLGCLIGASGVMSLLIVTSASRRIYLAAGETSLPMATKIFVELNLFWAGGMLLTAIASLLLTVRRPEWSAWIWPAYALVVILVNLCVALAAILPFVRM